METGGDAALDYIYNEVVVGNCYGFDSIAEQYPDVLMAVDLGASFGPSSAMICRAWPKVTVLAIEPNETRYGLLVKNIEDSNGRVLHRRAAVVGSNRSMVGWQSPWRDSADSAYEEVKATNAPIVFPNVIFDDWDVDLLKIDVEGWEWGILHDLSEQGRLPRIIVGEWHFENAKKGVYKALCDSHKVVVGDGDGWGPFWAYAK